MANLRPSFRRFAGITACFQERLAKAFILPQPKIQERHLHLSSTLRQTACDTEATAPLNSPVSHPTAYKVMTVPLSQA